MPTWCLVLVASAVVPLLRAIWANRRTTLIHALIWGLAAWGAWVWTAYSQSRSVGYVAISLTACSGVAVLGARRPGAGPWNVVVAGLLAVLLIPLAQDFLTGNSWFTSGLWMWFVVLVPGLVIVNFAGSKAVLGGFALEVACVLGLVPFIPHVRSPNPLVFAVILAGISPWLAWVAFLIRKRPADETERLWCDFRDRFGLMWEVRLREQFNLAAKNAGLAVELWGKRLRRTDGTVPDERESQAAREILTALVKRFGLS